MLSSENNNLIWLKKFRSQKLRSLENISLHIEHQSVLFVLSPLYILLTKKHYNANTSVEFRN